MPMYYHNEILFSEIYLEEITRQAENADVLASLKVLGEYREYADTHNLKAWKESYVHEVLSALGFFAQSIPTPLSRCISENDHLTYLFSMGSNGKENPLSLCYVILPDENLDNTTIGRNWAEKIIRALREKSLQWGLLTNGKQWRIYHQYEPTPYETYLEIDLEAILKEKAKEAYQIFHKFMKAENFAAQEDGKCQFDRFKKESQDKIDYIEKELANALRQREEGGKGVLSDLCMGYVEELRHRNEGNVEDEALRKKIYHGAMLYMFRLLFLFYADARRLLSDENHDLLAKVEGECRTRHDGNGSSNLTFPIWDSLEHIFVDIDQTYNGGLFSPQESEFTRFLSDTRISDAYLANVIFNLTTYKEKNGQEKPISYRDMSVRHLGTLYEGLLEHKLFIATEDTEVKVAKGKIQFIPASQGGKLIVGHYIKAGEVYFAGDPSERKSTGSYYTPEYIVEYIVRNTVGEKLKELKDVFLQEQHSTMDAYQSAVDGDERSALRNLLEENSIAFVREKVLEISVLDPAMGSGHFLVNATNLISNFISGLLNEIGIEGSLESSTGYWRRWVVENCIYGVDLNPLAVELAKLSLWILSMAKDQPLSFLNHHLKCGNSLVGAKLEDIGNHPFSTTKKEVRQLNLFEQDPAFKSAVKEVISKSRLIAAKPSFSLEDVREKKEWLEQIDHILEGYKIICDVHTSLYFGNKMEESQYDGMVQKRDFALARLLNKPNQFFHWELEFPNVFLSTNGFYCVVGNPPYVNIANLPEKYRNVLKQTFSTYKNKCDLYSLFLEKAISLVNLEDFKLSLIIPQTWLATESFYLLRKTLIEKRILDKIIDLGHGVFVDSFVSTVIIVLREKTHQTKILDGKFSLRREISINDLIKKDFFIDIQLSDKKEQILLKLGINTIPLGEILRFSRGIKTSNDSRFITSKFKGQEYKKVFRGRNIRPYQLIWGGEYVWYRPDLMREKVGCLPHSSDFFEVPEKLVTQRINSTYQLMVAYDDQQNYFLDTVNVSRYSSLAPGYSLKFLCGLLNSKLINYWYCQQYRMPTISGYELHTIPIPVVTADQQIPIINNVARLLKNSTSELDVENLRIDIDRLVYDLYDLSGDEISIIENQGKTE